VRDGGSATGSNAPRYAVSRRDIPAAPAELWARRPSYARTAGPARTSRGGTALGRGGTRVNNTDDMRSFPDGRDLRQPRGVVYSRRPRSLRTRSVKAIFHGSGRRARRGVDGVLPARRGRASRQRPGRWATRLLSALGRGAQWSYADKNQRVGGMSPLSATLLRRCRAQLTGACLEMPDHMVVWNWSS
jgi:hypothetical protein